MEKLLQSAFNAVFGLAAASVVAVSTNAVAAEQAASAPAPEMEQCYGIAKAGSNDCAAGAVSCAGSAVKDKQPDAFLFMPKGLCQKIVGGIVK